MHNSKKKLTFRKVVKKIAFLIVFIIILLGLLSYLITPFFV